MACRLSHFSRAIGRLMVAWTFSTGMRRGHEGAPIVVGRVMYMHTPFPNTIYALDLDHDARILWRYSPRQEAGVIPVMGCDTVYRALTDLGGRLFLHQADTTAVALDPDSGRALWSRTPGSAPGATS